MEDVIDIQRFTIREKKCLYLCLLDGHGGVHAAEVAQGLLYEKLLGKISEVSGDINWYILLSALFEEVNDALSKQVNEWPKRWTGEVSSSGCTCTLVIIEEDTGMMTWANLGDSRAVLFNDTECKASTPDHRVSVPKERQRLLSRGAQCVLRNGNWFLKGKAQGDTASPSNLYLSVSRALGDFWTYLPDRREYPVCPTPDVARMVFEDMDTMIVASDGLWDAMSNSEVMRSVVLQDDLDLALSRIVGQIKQENKVKDNISIIVVKKGRA